ncbi:MAG: DUF3046 domain-containing protein [Microbacteriaceae bacterium]|nr:DUF3046 domain-containing protein [Microbacteriaceae bacterium]
MQMSEFRRACAAEFGEVYAGVVLRDHWLTRLGCTGAEAFAAGVAAREVWLALCEEFAVPEERRYGRGLREVR